jgi:hypothetical protein
LEFLNPVFNEGLNVTVRNGDKWLHRVKPGDRVLLAKTGETPVMDSQNRVVGVFFCSLDELPSSILRHEHDPACRTKAGLRKCLDETYGPSPNGHRMVTAIVWLRDTRQGGGPWGSD